MNRVVITGMGTVNPIGNNIETFSENLFAGVCGIGPITKFDTTGFKVTLAAEVKDFDPLQYYDSLPEARRADLFTQYATAAAIEAVRDSGIQGNVQPQRFGVYVGSGIGGMNTFTAETLKLDKRGPSRVSPLFIPMMISNMAAGAISIRFGAKGPSLPVVTACATSTNTIGEAFRAIKHGYADAIIAGGTESTITPLATAGFDNCKALSQATDPARASIPFDKERSGFVMGEGATMLILEEYSHAVARGAKIYAEICGYGNTSDAYHMTAPHPEAEGAGEAIRLAAEEGGITAGERLYINAHGTSTPMNDKTETLAIKKAFGEAAYTTHISSTKSMTGHMLGATGATEAAACVLALQKQMIPPTIHYQEKDPECDLDYTPNNAVSAEIDAAISSSLGFGGHNAVIALKKI